jgi:hypothetical protein
VTLLNRTDGRGMTVVGLASGSPTVTTSMATDGCASPGVCHIQLGRPVFGVCRYGRPDGLYVNGVTWRFPAATEGGAGGRATHGRLTGSRPKFLAASR